MTIQAHIVLLTIAYAALSALLLFILVYLPIRRALKIGVIATMCVLNIGIFFWLQGLPGWSSATAVPDRFKLLWARVVEPNPSRGFPGAIHLWVEALDDHNIPSGEPRAYLLPYSTELATKATESQSEIKKGNAQGGFGLSATYAPVTGGQAPEGATVRTVTQTAAPGGDPSGGGALDPSVLGGQSKVVDLIPLPKPLLPPKETP